MEKEGAEGLRTVSRTMAVLRALNSRGYASVVELSRECQISRPALYRILATLEKEGYVKREARGSCYRLTREVLELSAGYRDQDWLTELAEPFMERLQKDLLWPTDLATYEFGQMVLRDTTRRLSPWVFDYGKVGLRLPVLHTSLGLAYMAALEDAGMQGVLARLRQSRNPLDEIANEKMEVEARIGQARKHGYALRPPGFVSHTNSIAVALKDKMGPVGAIGFTFVASAMSDADAVKKLLPPLQAVAEALSLRLRDYERVGL